MLTKTIRKIEHVEIAFEGEDLPDVLAQANAGTPDGFDLVQAHVLAAAGGRKKTTARYARVDTQREITGETRTDILAQVPEGWQIWY